MWLDHLRGPGQYRGDVILFTNIDGMAREGVTQRPYPNVPTDARCAHVDRVLSYYIVPVEQYEVGHADGHYLLTVADINQSFPTDEKLWAAPSDAATLDCRHAYPRLPRLRRWTQRFSGWRTSELGVPPASSPQDVGVGTELWGLGGRHSPAR